MSISNYYGFHFVHLVAYLQCVDGKIIEEEIKLKGVGGGWVGVVVIRVLLVTLSVRWCCWVVQYGEFLFVFMIVFESK